MYTRHMRSRIEKLTNPQTRKEKRRQKALAGLLGAAAINALVPKQTFTMYNGENNGFNTGN